MGMIKPISLDYIEECSYFEFGLALSLLPIGVAVFVLFLQVIANFKVRILVLFYIIEVGYRKRHK